MTTQKSPGRAAVIIPAYNVGRYLPECLDSLARQTYREFRVFVVDDGSTDSSPETAGRYCDADSRFVLLRQQNLGAAAARNAGLEAVAGSGGFEFVSFVDADDFVADDYLEKFTGALDAGGCDYGVCGFCSFNRRGRRLKGVQAPFTFMDQDGIAAQFFGIDGALNPLPRTANTALFLCNRFFRWSAVGGLRFGNDLRNCQDQDYFIRSMRVLRRGVSIPDVLYFYRRRAGSNSNSLNAKKFDLLIYERLAGELESFPPAARAGILNNFARQLVQGAYAVLASPASREEKQEFMRKAAGYCRDLAASPLVSADSKRKLQGLQEPAALLRLHASAREMLKKARRIANRYRYFP